MTYIIYGSYFSSIIAFILCLVCAAYAVGICYSDKHDKSPGATGEFLVRNLTAGAWFFGVVAVLSVLYGTTISAFAS